MYDKLLAVFESFLQTNGGHFSKKFAKIDVTSIEREKIKTYMIIEGLVSEQEVWGKEMTYNLSDAGKRFYRKLAKFQSLDLILEELDKRKNISTPTLKQICGYVSVQYEQSLGEYLVDDRLVTEVPSKDVEKSFRINDVGERWLRNGGYVSWIAGRIDTVYRQENKSVSIQHEPEHLHERILFFLEEKSKADLNEFQCLSDKFPDVQFKVLNSITQQLKVRHQVESKTTGPLNMSFHISGTRDAEPKPQPSLPSKVYAYITVEGIAEVKRLKNNQPSIPAPSIQNTYNDHSNYVDQSVKVEAQKIDTVATNVETLNIAPAPSKEEPKNKFIEFIKKFWGWIVTIIVGVLAKLIIDYFA